MPSLLSDIGTPVSIFHKLSAQEQTAFLFESTEGDSRLYPRSLPNEGQTQGDTPNVQPGGPGAPFQGTQIQNNQVMATPVTGQQKQSPTTLKRPAPCSYRRTSNDWISSDRCQGCRTQLCLSSGWDFYFCSNNGYCTVPNATLSVLGLGLLFLTITCVMIGIVLAKYITVPETIARKR